MTPPLSKPYWYVDLKWVFGLVLLASLGATLLLFAARQVTERETAINLSAGAIGAYLTHGNTDDQAGIDKLKAQAAAAPNQTIYPIPGFPTAALTLTDLNTLTTSQITQKLFSQVTSPIYDLGIEGAAKKFSSDPAAQQSFIKQASLLRVMTKTTHDKISTLFIILALVSALLLLGLILFSFGWGKLGDPGLIFFITGLPGAFVGLLLAFPHGDGTGVLSALPLAITKALGHQLLVSYGVVLVIGLVALLIALVGSIISRHHHANSQ